MKPLACMVDIEHLALRHTLCDGHYHETKLKPQSLQVVYPRLVLKHPLHATS